MKIIERCTHGNRIIGGCKLCAKVYAQRRKTFNRAKYLWEAAHARAKRRGVPFSITVADVIVPATCPVLGIPIDWRSRDYAASVDEIVQGRGYVQGNFCVVSGRVNRIKSDASLLELKAIAAYVEIKSSNKFGSWGT